VEPVLRHEASIHRPGSGNGWTEPALAEALSATQRWLDTQETFLIAAEAGIRANRGAA